jgi:transcriptional regulator with PAS, ATPase and Fis domain
MNDLHSDQRIKEQLELYHLIFNNIPSGAMVTDPQGMVTHLNKPYADFLGIDVAAGLGRHCTEVVENSRMHVVGRSGLAEVNQIQMIRGQNIVVHRIPIKKEGEVIAVFGLVMFQDIGEVVKLARKLHSLESRVKSYEKELLQLRSTRYTLDSIIGVGPAITALKQAAQLAAGNNAPVLITGESGTGKELFAQAIHHAGMRKLRPFIHINCAAIPKDLLESELFGYDKGAFTGALSAGKPGKFEIADGGTIFLDEIGDLPLEMQPKLLRVLEEKCFERIGGNTLIRSDFRLVAATNQDLEGLIARGLFRKDLYYRLNVISLQIPPLRQRREDIPSLANHLLTRLAKDSGYASIRVSQAAMAALVDHGWQGNVRELGNVLERALLVMHGEEINVGDLPFLGGRNPSESCPVEILPIRAARAETEKAALVAALEKTGNNKAKAASLLGIHRTLLYRKLKQYGLQL